MKKLFCIAAMTLLAVGAFAQGTITFANDSAHAITNALTSQRPLTTEIVFGLWASTTLGLGQNDSSLAQVGATAPSSSPGRFSAGTYNVGNANQTVTLQVRAWGAGFATYDAAVLGGGLRGKSV